MKKTLASILILILMLFLVSCGDSQDNKNITLAENKTTGAQEDSIYNNILKQILEFKTEIVLNDVSHEEASDTFLKVLEDHPEVFWIDSSHSVRYDDTSTTLILITSGNTNEIKSQKETFDKKVNEIVSKVPAGDDYTKALFLHDYLVESVDYSKEALALISSNGAENQYVQETTSYGAIVNNSAVCSGYSAAYKCLLEKVGIESSTVSGASLKNGGSHSWNIVKMDGDYYHTDVTWDDPSFDGNDNYGVFYSYFGVTTEEITKTHSIEAGQNIPVCKALKDNYFVRENMFFEKYSFETAAPIISNGLVKDGKISIKFANHDEYEKCLKDMFDDNKVFEIDFFKDKTGKKNISHSEDSEMNIVTFLTR